MAATKCGMPGEGQLLPKREDAHAIIGYRIGRPQEKWVNAVVTDVQAGVMPGDVTSAWAALFRLHRAERMTTSIKSEPQQWRDQLAQHTVGLAHAQLLTENRS